MACILREPLQTKVHVPRCPDKGPRELLKVNEGVVEVLTDGETRQGDPSDTVRGKFPYRYVNGELTT
jgi:hypothetical protein